MKDSVHFENLIDNLVRGLDYYTHTVFEVVSVNKEMGAQSTVFAGGRYDGLVEYFGGPEGMRYGKLADSSLTMD